MKHYIYFIPYIFLKLLVGATEDNQSLENYLNQKSMVLSTKQQIHLHPDSAEYNLERFDYHKNNETWKFAHSFSLFNESYLMLDTDIHKTFEGRFIRAKPLLEAVDDRKRITMAKVIQMGNLGLMFVVLNDKYVRIIKFTDIITNYQTVQTIEHQRISDVAFFKQENEVFLIVSNDNGNNLVPVSLYKWSDGQFDQQETLLLTGVKQIKTFEDGGREVLLLLQKIDKDYYCNVYEYEDQKLNKRRAIKIDMARFILPYKIKNEQFILFLNNQRGSIYRWSGFDLVKWSMQDIDTDFNRTLVVYSNNKPIIFGISSNEINMYSPSSEKLELVRTENNSHEFKRILDVEYIRWNGTDILFLIGNIEDYGMVESFTIKVSDKTIEEIPKTKDPIYICLNELNDKLANIPKTPTLIKSRGMRSLTTDLEQPITDVELEDKFAEIEDRYSSVAPVIEEFNRPGNEIVVNGDLIINGTIKGDELSTQNMNIKTVNAKQWTPNQWLSHSRNQTISGFIQAKNLRIKRLDVTNEVTIFDDILLNNTKSEIRGSVTVNDLKTTGIFVNDINNIKLKDVFMREKDSLITGTKTFRHIRAGSVETKNVMNENSQNILPSLDRMFTTNRLKSSEFPSHVFIDNLEVNEIDGVNWDTFKDSVFRFGTTKAIKGNIRIKSFSSENLNAITLNGLNVDKFMTTSTDQNITAPIQFSNIFASNITTNSINGISPSEVATIKNSSIKGPVVIEDIYITGDIVFNISMNDSLRRDQHIVGTDESDFLQLYTDRVKIIGNLRVRNLKTDPAAVIALGNGDEIKEFDSNFPENYWMKNENQKIPVHVEMHDGMTTPHLQTMLLNNFGMLNYLLNNTNKTFPGSFAFENVTFLENVFLNDEKLHTPDLKSINAESVKTNGTFVIRGTKIFKDSLKIKNLMTDELNNMKPSQLIHSNGNENFSGLKIFEKLIINGDLTTRNHSCVEINDVNLKQLLEDSVYIDRPQDFERLNFANITIGNPIIETLNDKPIDEYMVETNDMFDSGVIDSLIINGKLTIGNLMNLSKINEKDPEVLYINKMEVDEQGVLHGHVRFTRNVTIDNLSASFINNINFPLLTSRLLYKSGNQTIPGLFNFKNIITENFVASQINGVNIDNLVNIDTFETQKIFATGGIEFSSANFDTLNGDKIEPCNIEKALEAIKSPPTQTWSNMKIIGNVTIMDHENILYDIFENVVLTNEKNIINAAVHFSNISVENLLTHKHINNIDLGEIFKDALLKQSDKNQIISGRNVFQNLGVYKAVVLNNSDIPYVNGFEISKIAQQIIPKDEVHIVPIRGKKTFFAGLQTDKIKSKIVSNVIPENFVTLNDSRIIPSATFEYIEIKKDLSVARINDHDFNHFLEERLLVSGPPVQEVSSICSFNEIHIEGNLTTPSINDIEINDVVFDTSYQEITSKKTFLNNLYVTGNVDIEMLNEYEISKIYEKAALKNQESYIQNNVEIVKPSSVNGLIHTEFINGYSVEKIRQILSSQTADRLRGEVDQMIDSIEELAKKNYKLIERFSSEVMYIEKSTDLQISFPKTINAHTFNLRDHVMIQIEGESEGHNCGMPNHCKCPLHYTVQISPENSISYFISKDFQRVYNYADDYMAAHLVTNTITTDMICRTNTSHSESSTLAWNTVRSGNTTGNIYTHPIDFTGYVSAVEYFSLKNITYVIIGTYYNSTANSYDMDSVVLKFNRDRTSVSEIQRIKTVGVWSLKVFYTVQGVNLIIGMVGDGHPNTNYEKTLFMRFDEIGEKFFLLREVPAYGCSSSVGIVLKTESFIALSHRKHPLLIFKYDKHQDNYVYYQHLWEPSLVRGISLFYDEDYDINDPYLCIVSEHGVYSIYTYEFIGGWQRKFRGVVDGLRNLIPFEFKQKLYLFAPSTNESSVLSVAKFGMK